MERVPKYGLIDEANPDENSRRKSSIRVAATVILNAPNGIHASELGEIAVYEQSWIRNLRGHVLKIPNFREDDGWYWCDQPEELLWPANLATVEDVRLFQKIENDMRKRRQQRERNVGAYSEDGYGSPDTQPREMVGDFEDYQHLVDEAYNPPVIDRPPKVVDTAIVRLIKEPPPAAPDRLRQRFESCLVNVDEIREDLTLIKRLSDRNHIPYETPNPFLEAHQKRMDDAIGSFVEVIAEHTGYMPPPIRCSCPICLDIVRDAVCLDCGHLACHECLSDPLVPRHGDTVKCPLCSKLGRWRKIYLS